MYYWFFGVCGINNGSISTCHTRRRTWGSDLSTHIKARQGGICLSSSVGRRRPKGPWGLLARQCGWVSEFQVQWETLSERVESDQERQPVLASGLCKCAQMHACMHACTAQLQTSRVLHEHTHTHKVVAHVRFAPEGQMLGYFDIVCLCWSHPKGDQTTG